MIILMSFHAVNDESVEPTNSNLYKITFRSISIGIGINIIIIHNCYLYNQINLTHILPLWCYMIYHYSW